MKHDDMRELLALRLYGEIDDAERERVAQHLDGCADCRAFTVELEHGLGAVHRQRVALDDAWIEALKRSVAEEQPVPRVSPWWIAASSFAAGFLAFWIASRVMTPQTIGSSEHDVAQHSISPYERFLGDVPPPRSDSRGELSRLGEYFGH